MFTASQAANYDAWRTSYPSHWDAEEERNDYIDTEVDVRTSEGEDFYPFSFDNFVEFLTEMTDETEKQSFMNLINNHALEINQLRTSAMLYWCKQARALVEHELDHP